jgi:predicted Zn finger-like uncharacterized protein
MLLVCPTCASEYRIDPAKLGAGGRRVRCSSCQTDWFASPDDAQTPPDHSREPGRAERSALDDELYAHWNEAAVNDPDVAEALAAFEAAEKLPEPEAEAAPRDDFSGSGEGVGHEDGGPPPEPSPSQDDGPGAAPTGRSSPAPAEIPAPRKSAREKRARKPGRHMPLPVAAARPRSRAGLAACIGLVALGLMLWRREAVARHVPALAGPLAAIGLPVNLRGAAFDNVTSEVISDPSGRFLIVQSQIRNVTGRAIAIAPVEIVVRDVSAKPIYTWAAEPPKATLQPGESMHFRTRLAQPPQEAHDVQLRFQRASAQMAQAAK